MPDLSSLDPEIMAWNDALDLAATEAEMAATRAGDATTDPADCCRLAVRDAMYDLSATIRGKKIKEDSNGKS